MKRKFFDTWVAKFAGLDSQQSRVLKYIIEHQDQILARDELLALILPIRTIIKTPMAELFNNLVNCEQLDNFAAFYTPSKESIPELLTASNITLDLKQFRDSESILINIPVLKNKILLNLTNTLRRDTRSGEVSVNAIDNFQNLFVRGQLVAGYTDLEEWLTPTLQEYTIRTYSMILSAIISRYYNLTVTEQMDVAIHFALYMSQMLTPGDKELTHPPILARCTSLAKRSQLQEVCDQCAEVSKDGLTTKSICELIVQHGPDKLQHFDQAALNALCDNLGPDLISSRIALEYPPYWVYHLILALSGTAKIPLIYQLNNQRLMNEGRSKFLTSLYSTELFNLDAPLRR